MRTVYSIGEALADHPRPRLLGHLREGLADPFAQEIALPPVTLTRAEARAIERALTSARRPRRLGASRIVLRGVEVHRG